MGSSSADKVPLGDEAEGPETTIEIKIKTLDSQTYTMRVNKQMPVPALKEQIASVTGVLSEQQRLICRGKVLKDDQLLSAYHVEDGHTLHLVVRQPPPSSDGLSNHPATDPASSTSDSQGRQVAPSVVIETFNVPNQGDGIPPEFSRIVSAVLGSFGIPNIGSGSEGIDVRTHGPLRNERTLDPIGASEATLPQPEQTGMRGQFDRSHNVFGLPTSVQMGSLNPPVIPDSLATLSQYLSHVRRELDAIGRGLENNSQAASAQGTEERGPNYTSPSLNAMEGLPTPASLAEVIQSTRQMLVEQVGDALLQLARQLENQANVTDTSLRSSIQTSAWRTGVLLHNLGSFLLELGRTTMTLRLGQTPAEALVNAGPAVFISSSGPNPLMVQPFPFQSGTSFGSVPMGSMQPGSGLVNGLGVQRRIDIQIRRGSSAATPNVTREELGDPQHPSGLRNPATNSAGGNLVNQAASGISVTPSFSSESGVRLVPVGTMVAAVPGQLSRLQSDSSVNGLYYPVLGRIQHVDSGHVSGERGSQPSSELHSVGIQAVQQSVPEPAMQQQNNDGPARDGPGSNLRQQEPSNARSVNFNILSDGGTQNNQESGRQIPSSVVQLLSALFPGGEIHVEDAGFQGSAPGPIPENTGTSSSAADALASESRISDEGIFLSNLLCQIMPLISQNAGAEPNAASQNAGAESTTQAGSSDVGTSNRQSDPESSPPNSKRQKME